MSGFYLIGVIVLWLWLTSLLWKGWRRWGKAENDNRNWRNGAAFVISILWFGASFWYAGGRKFYYDWQVEKLCAVDGGVKVYETVKLPADEFDKWGMPKIFRDEVENRAAYRNRDGQVAHEYFLGQVYILKRETRYLRQGNPKIVQMNTRIIRRSDGKVLGESVYYGRGGGDLYGPWHPSGFTCPDPTSKPYLEPSIFQQGAQQ